MVVNFYTYLKQLCCIGPVENTCFLRKDLKCSLILALCLNNRYNLESSVDHKVPWLEADQF